MQPEPTHPLKLPLLFPSLCVQLGSGLFLRWHHPWVDVCGDGSVCVPAAQSAAQTPGRTRLHVQTQHFYYTYWIERHSENALSNPALICFLLKKPIKLCFSTALTVRKPFFILGCNLLPCDTPAGLTPSGNPLRTAGPSEDLSGVTVWGAWCGPLRHHLLS